MLVCEWSEKLGEGWSDGDWFRVGRNAEAVGGRADGLGHGGHKRRDGAVAWIEEAQAAVILSQLENHHRMVGDLGHVFVEKGGEEGLGLGVHIAREWAVPVFPCGGVEIKRHVVHDVGSEEARQLLGGALLLNINPTCGVTVGSEYLQTTNKVASNAAAKTDEVLADEEDKAIR